MSNFKTLKGLYIKHVSSDPSNLIEGQIWYNTTTQTIKVAPEISAWASGGNLGTGRYVLAGAGTQTAGLTFGGADSPVTAYNAETEEYDGSSWTESGDLGTARRSLASAGTQTAALAFGGGGGTTPHASNPFTIFNATEEYNGTGWTAGGDLTTARHSLGGAGTQTAGLAFGGQPPTMNNSEEYDGSSWTEGDNLNTARHYVSGCGLQTAGLAIGGSLPPYTGATEEYDGSSWTAGNNLNTTRGYGAGCGIQTAALFFAGGPGYLTATEGYDGTSWTALPSLATARYATAGAGTKTAGLAIAGRVSGGVVTAATEEFTAATTARSVDTT